MLSYDSFKNQFRTLLDRKGFEKFISGNDIDIEFFELNRLSLHLFLDEEERLRTGLDIPRGIMLYASVVKKRHFIFLNVMEEDEVDEYKCFLYKDEYDKLMETGKLPSDGKCNVFQKLQELGAEEPFKLAGELVFESARISKNIPTAPEDVEVYLTATGSDAEKEYELVVSYGNSRVEARDIFEELLQEKEIEKVPVKRKMATFFKILGKDAP